jgi:hypothetical protein
MKNSREIVRIKFGSHLYGTNLPSSDIDIKSVYLPCGKDILLQRVKPTISDNTKLDPNSKNSNLDIDNESFSLQQFLKLLTEGQTIALDALFAPDSFLLPLSNGTVLDPLWTEIRSNKDRFLTRGINSFVGYARRQAAKYGIKGGRVAAVRAVLELLKTFDKNKKLLEYQDQLRSTIYNQDTPLEHAAFVDCKGPQPGQLIPHLEVCDRKIPFTNKVRQAVEVYQKVFDEYGARALLAEKNESVDWKACMHAVRVNAEAIELLSTGHITFPRPEAPLLLQIRKGELEYKKVSEIIESGFTAVGEAAETSTLRETPDLDFVDEIVAQSYLSQVVGGVVN